MAEPLKAFFSPDLVKRIADDVRGAEPSFPARAFVRKACAGLDALELLDRGKHIAGALAAYLPPDYPDAIDVLLRSLGPEHDKDELLGAGMAPFYYLPHVLFVAEQGLEHFEPSMRAQYELTKRFSAEFSIRFFLERDPERTFARLAAWAGDDNAHVRRLASEGTRMRLPWAKRVGWLDQNPHRIVALLERLRDDPSTVVRRSVANNLNDLGKLYPELLVDTCRRWLVDATPERRALVEHALRSAVKRSEPGALAVLGYGKRPRVTLERVAFEPLRVVIGGHVVARFSLRSAAEETQALLVDVAVHFVKAHGKTSAKVFKVGRVELAGQGTVELRARISLAVHTTRKPRPGVHAVDVLVNGQRFPAGAFEVVGAGGARR